MTATDHPRIYFMHVKKCAGTSLVGLARRQNDRVRLPEPNANAIPLHPEDTGLKNDARWIRFWEWPLAEQKRFIDDLDCTFFANEGRITKDFERMEGMFYLLCLREGLGRFISHYRHFLRGGKVSGDLSEFIETPEKNPGLLNFATYQLSGRRVAGYDPVALKIACRNIDKFDHIVFSETYESDVQVLVDRFGWGRPEELPKRNSADDDDGVCAQLTPEMLGRLAELNASDVALHAYARRLFPRP
ncbi:Sulfotransferase family protein [Salinihabitans flavidus]|uniref:Sulfotransferase family protein n=1 Tax=Salinihabitans flavidus TaxID=569882 RepID=A0A1H8V1N7_9RHOB|nr:sulfotransferase family 2 domain-containing protein [Salinihabitans flavidus]SEP09339.1 Sulfotransferase family protein [Salinihabitans flavidus]